MDVAQTRQYPELINVHKQLGKGIDYREIGGKLGAGSTLRWFLSIALRILTAHDFLRH